jgi:predicted nucleotidyltransferase
MNIVEIKKILEKNNNYLRQTFHIMELGIFGSFVKGEEKIDNASDIDILITFEKGYKDFFNYMRLKYYLEDLLGLEVDLVIKEAIKPRLKERIFREVEYV